VAAILGGVWSQRRGFRHPHAPRYSATANNPDASPSIRPLAGGWYTTETARHTQLFKVTLNVSEVPWIVAVSTDVLLLPLARLKVNCAVDVD
jgi:hypothetical protein